MSTIPTPSNLVNLHSAGPVAVRYAQMGSPSPGPGCRYENNTQPATARRMDSPAPVPQHSGSDSAQYPIFPSSGRLPQAPPAKYRAGAAPLPGIGDIPAPYPVDPGSANTLLPMNEQSLNRVTVSVHIPKQVQRPCPASAEPG